MAIIDNLKGIMFFLGIFLFLNSVSFSTDFMGQIKDKSTGLPLANVQIIIIETADTAISDASGNYFIPNIPQGTYTILIGSTNYQPYSKFPTYIGSCCTGIRGNINGDPSDQVDISDLTFIVNYMFQGGPAPQCQQEGNIDGDPAGEIGISDLTFLVEYLFGGGPYPSTCP